MGLDYKKMEKALKDFAESPEGVAYFENIGKIHRLKLERFKRFEKWLENNDFEAFMYRLILEHNDEYREKCYHKGYEPYPNRKLSFLIDYIVDNLQPMRVPQLDCDFNNEVWFFKGYYFQMIWGQGVITKIFTGQDMKNVLTV